MTALRTLTAKDTNGKLQNYSLVFENGHAIFENTSEHFRANNYLYMDEFEMLYYYEFHAEVHFPQIVDKLAS